MRCEDHLGMSGLNEGEAKACFVERRGGFLCSRDEISLHELSLFVTLWVRMQCYGDILVWLQN